MSRRSASPTKNFILRIARDEWFKQVFEIKRYYPGVARRWERDGIIFLVKRTDRGDSMVGYGVIKRFIARDDLSEKERRECERTGWRGAIVFDELYKFEPPILIKETILGGLKAKGRCWHGYPVTLEQAKSILEDAKNLSTIKAI
ncbi:MAG: hypothetical protein QW502_03995 [Candidatus Bathyarchaeia archaeon]|nr:hypothetical protein [Candidatus Bathyarchaeota archaeon]